MILGEKIPFSVKINETQLVDELKKGIKKENENRFEGLDARDLMLYKVNVAKSDKDYRGIREAIIQGSFELKETDELEPTEAISDHFTDLDPPKSKAIHIVVVAPQSKSIDP